MLYVPVSKKRILIHLLVASGVALLQFFGGSQVFSAVDSVPRKMIYEGTLMNSSHQPLSGNYDFRFSLWSDEDVVGTDISGGVINTLSPNYLTWQEVQTDILDVNGTFSLELGKVTSLDFDKFNIPEIYLQVEIKASTDPDTSYELLDVDTLDDAVDRMVFDTIPYAYNADKIDFRDIGTDPENIPYLDSNGELPASVFPSNLPLDGTTSESFTIDTDDTAAATDSLTLVFGETLQKTMSWDGLLDSFVFNDDVKITGNLIVTGTVNGVPIGQASNQDVLSPRYPNSLFVSDGSDNQGEMHEETETIATEEKSFLRWTTWEATLQDYDTVIRYTLPDNFVSWDVTQPVSVEIKTDGTNVQSKIDITVEKDGVAGTDQISGTGIGLSENAWTEKDFVLNGVTSWAPGDVLVLKIRQYAIDGFDSRVSDVFLRYLGN
ncbi:hypothetical protein HC823_00665 [Candidatus Gracilibacteria bacterium]|nr:hypothetical protein [Candidatus Gracilibacteria bacterium]